MAAKGTRCALMSSLAVCFLALLFAQAAEGEANTGFWLDTNQAVDQQQRPCEYGDCMEELFVRKLQQDSDSAPACTWVAGECRVNTFGKVHDVDTANYILASVVCSNHVVDQADCQSNLHCLWYGSDCRQDYLFYLQDCVQQEWLTLYRALLCNQFTNQEKCEVIAGCNWNKGAGKCTEDFNEVAKDIGANSDLRDAFEKFSECQSKTECDDFCTPGEGGTCDYVPLSDPINWFIDPPPSQHCQVQLQLHRCFDSKSCDTPCEPHADGTCGMDFYGKDVIRLLHEDNAVLKKELLRAVNKCPKQKSEFECDAYGN
ncbi:unnamed protein product [Ostreobium quekettii]|uniref:Uncharacterized protein n=1 Tax=Ostreobium quekettii TaxID=121088 RepID=A0A8S1IZ03_9CHLO|nr:unnamed protein product [Ostreobium quekettii]